jgi:hypothetical protein
LSFLQGKERYNFPNPNPFVEDDMDKNEIASVAYRYVSSLVGCSDRLAHRPCPVWGDLPEVENLRWPTSFFFTAVTAGGS